MIQQYTLSRQGCLSLSPADQAVAVRSENWLEASWSLAASHVSVLDVLPVHQHVLPAQGPHLALAHHHMALEHLAAVRVNLGGGRGVDAVLLEERHRIPWRK